MSDDEVNYILHPSKPHYWVNLYRNKISKLGEGSKIILDNLTLGGKYIIPFNEISSIFDLNDPSVDFWRMWLASISSQPHVFTINPCEKTPEGRILTREARDFFDATRYYVPTAEDEIVEKSTVESISSKLIEPEELAVGQFEMEDELEGFIYANWKDIPIFSKLEKFDQPQSHPGRQVKTDIGTIDFLAKDPNTGQFIVIELKKEKTSDETTGQILRYMGWVAKNWAQGNQAQVRGIIICQNQDERLKYAASCLSDRIDIFEYQVKFQLNQAERIL